MNEGDKKEKIITQNLKINSQNGREQKSNKKVYTSRTTKGVRVALSSVFAQFYRGLFSFNIFLEQKKEQYNFAVNFICVYDKNVSPYF